MKNAMGQTDNVLILGGGSEIGVAIAEELASIGTRRVILAGPNEQSLRRAAAQLEGSVDEVTTASFDATATETHKAFFTGLVERCGDIDVVVIAFGVLPDQHRAEDDPEVAVEAALVNYVGALSAMLNSANTMRRQGHGAIIVLSSVAGERARRSNFIYGSTKAGLNAAAEGLGYALEGSGVTLVTVRPGFVRTKMTAGLEEGPMAVAAVDVAKAAVEAMAAERSVVWVPSQLRYVFAGIRHLPRAAMKRIKA